MTRGSQENFWVPSYDPWDPWDRQTHLAYDDEVVLLFDSKAPRRTAFQHEINDEVGRNILIHWWGPFRSRSTKELSG